SRRCRGRLIHHNGKMRVRPARLLEANTTRQLDTHPLDVERRAGRGSGARRGPEPKAAQPLELLTVGWLRRPTTDDLRLGDGRLTGQILCELGRIRLRMPPRAPKWVG